MLTCIIYILRAPNNKMLIPYYYFFWGVYSEQQVLNGKPPIGKNANVLKIEMKYKFLLISLRRYRVYRSERCLQLLGGNAVILCRINLVPYVPVKFVIYY